MYKAGPGDSTKIVKGVKVLKPNKGGSAANQKILGGHKIKGVSINPHMTTGEPSLKIHKRSK